MSVWWPFSFTPAFAWRLHFTAFLASSEVSSHVTESLLSSKGFAWSLGCAARYSPGFFQASRVLKTVSSSGCRLDGGTLETSEFLPCPAPTNASIVLCEASGGLWGVYQLVKRIVSTRIQMARYRGDSPVEM